MLLYVHVPFCVRKCGYCAFHSGPYVAADADRYVNLVLQEMTAQQAGCLDLGVDTVYFGGGTPSLLTPGQIGRILEQTAQLFRIAADAEITLEANPESILRPGKLSELRALGVNRLSLGVQSLHDDLLRGLGRPHDRRQALLAMDAAHAAGFSNLSLDLMWGLPGQTPSMWLDDLGQCAERAQHLSCYGLTLEEGTPLTGAVRAGRLALPDEEDGALMYGQGLELLESQGFVQYEVSNFARPGQESRHNMGYWRGSTYLGLGPAAVSTMHGRRWTNPATLDAYADMVEHGGTCVDTELLSPEVLARERIMLALRTRDGLDLERFQAMAEPHAAGLRAAVEQLCSGGLARQDAGHLHLTGSGMLVSNSIIELVLDLLDSGHGTTGNL